MQNNFIEIFVITNGRQTLPYTLRSIESQTIKCKLTIIENMVWIDALKKCAKDVKSRFYFRIDDDMFLHKFAVEYYIYKLKRAKNVGVYECKFWEDWSNKPAGSLKAYCSKSVQRIGFRPNKLGKVDKTFTKDLSKTKFKRIKNSSMIGLHSCASIKDQKKYRALWRDKNVFISPEEFAKTFDNLIHTCDLSLDNQYKLLNKIYRLNKKYKTDYFKFLNKKRSKS